MAIAITAKKAIEADAALGALMGDRIYPLNFPAGVTFPCMTYRVISGYAEEMPKSADVFRTRVQFDIWSYSYDTNASVKAALINLFNMSDMTVNGQHIIKGKVDLVFDLYDDDIMLHRSVVDIVFNHEGD